MAKHSIEKAAAAYHDAFVTVSDITANECKFLLGREPDCITPNGFENDFVWTGEEYDAKRAEARKTMISVAEACLGEKFAEEPLIVGTSGRYEFRNKGIDVFIESLKKLAASPVSNARCWPISPCRPPTAVRARTCRRIWPTRRNPSTAGSTNTRPITSNTRAATRSLTP